MLRPDSMLLPEFKKKLIAHTTTGDVFNRATGEWESGEPVDISFEGCILPLTHRDIDRLQISAPGQYSVKDKKLYVEIEDSFLNGTVIEDLSKQEKYEIYEPRGDYDVINPFFKIYYMKKIEKVAGK